MEAVDVLLREKASIPELRFPQFTGQWRFCKLGDITAYTKGYPFKSFDYASKGIRIIRVSDLDADKIKREGQKIFLPAEKAINYEKYRLKQGNIVITTVGSKPEMVASAVGRGVYISNDDEGLLNQNLLKFENSDGVDNAFVIALLNSQAYRQFIKGIARGNANQANITVADLNEFSVFIPDYLEQQKIGSFLSTVDIKIQQLTRKKELLEQYKKGVMQKLFSEKLRFKDENGDDYPDWEEKSYGEVYTFYSTNSLSRSNLNYESGVVKNIHYGDIHTKLRTLFDVTRETIPFINSNIDITKIKAENFCQEGDLIIADASEDYKDIGKSIELINLDNQKIVAGLHTFLARPDRSKIYIGFSGYLVQAEYVRKQVMTIAQGTKVLSLSTTRLGKVGLNLPCLEEQQKIANFLSSIDTKIETVASQITLTQTFKKGLLQQMFV